jgi:hypothetical protein
MTNEEVPGIVRDQVAGALRFQRALCRDYTECVKDKEIADRACKTWEETVERLVRIVFLYGHIVGSASEYIPDALTERERDMTPENLAPEPIQGAIT